MKRRMRYLYLEVKRTVGMFPRMLLQAVLLMALIGMIAFCGVKSMEKRFGEEALRNRIDVGLVVREDNAMTRMAIDYVKNLESVAGACRFVQVSEGEGRRMLEAGEVEALVVLPEKLIEGIMNGQNPSVEIYFPPENLGLETVMMRRLVETGVGLLRIAQAQSYGAYDTAAQYGMLSGLKDMEAAIDRYNLEFALDRLEIFDTQEVSATGRMSVRQYYAVSAAVLFMLLAGIAMYPAVQRAPASFVRQMKREGTGPAWQCFCKWLCGLFCMGIFVGGSWLLLRIAAAFVPGAGEIPAWLNEGAGAGCPPGVKAGMVFLVLICAATLIFLLYSLSGSRTGGILVIFLVSVAMVYLSGGFVPAVFLPRTMAAVGERLPTAYMMRACGVLFGAEAAGCCALWLCGYTAVFGAGAYLAWRRAEIG